MKWSLIYASRPGRRASDDSVLPNAGVRVATGLVSGQKVLVMKYKSTKDLLAGEVIGKGGRGEIFLQHYLSF